MFARSGVWALLSAACAAAAIAWCARGGVAAGPPHVEASSQIAAGRYVVQSAGCNDCHTPGWAVSNGTLPKSAWLTCSSVGSRGPWGTAYPPNLRLFAHALPVTAWVQLFRTSNGPGPMPWWNFSHGKMSDRDLAAIHAFIRHLGPAGTAAPIDLPPNVEPSTAYTWAVPPAGRH